MDFDISLCDTQPGAIWGLNQEFLSSPRLDNQSHCWTSLSALLEYSKSDDFTADGDIAMVRMACAAQYLIVCVLVADRSV